MPGPEPGMELAALVDLYALERLPSSKSLQNKHSIIRIFQRDTGVSHTAGITQSVVFSWRDKVLDRASRTTWNTYLREMRALFNFAVSTGRVTHNPFLEVAPVRTGKKRKKTVDNDLLQRSIALLSRTDEPLKPGWFWITVLRTLYYTGIRRRQLVHLRWSHVDFDKEILHLMAGGSKTRREWDVPIVPELMESLLELRDRTLRKCNARHISGLISGLQVFNASLFNPRYRG
ncbi:MAG TPA: site-specific integrase, partial [Thiotrichales bacterium]|nr:site-specific integrase [Thiotrichales bacterium]